MCEFRPGDEVERFRDNGAPNNPEATVGLPPIGHVGRVIDMGEGYMGVWIDLDNWPICPNTGLDPTEFRKVQRRDISAWLQTSVPNTDHLDKPLPAKKRERVQ